MGDLMRLGSLFAGIGGFDLGFHRAGFQPTWAVEIDTSCQRVLRHRFPGLRVESDVREVGSHNLEPVDVITFGFPCQDLSVAGKRKGLVGERSGLFWEAMRIIKELRPAFAIAENVPGLLSSHAGRDMAHVLWGFLDSGASDVTWAVLDAQYWGVAQRRRRVFIVGDFRSRSGPEILALADGLSGHPAPRREAGQDVAGTIGGGSGERGWSPDTDRMTFLPFAAPERADTLSVGANQTTGFVGEAIAWWDGGQTAASLTTRSHDQFMPDKSNFAAVITHTLSAEGHDASEDGTGRGTPIIPTYALQGGGHTSQGSQGSGWNEDVCFTLNNVDQHAIAFQQNQRDEVRDLGDVAGALPAQPGMKQQNYIAFTNRGIDSGTSAERLRAGSHGALPMVAATLTSNGDAQNGHRDEHGLVAVAFTERTRADGRNFEAQEDIAYALTNPGSGGRTHSRQIITPAMAVRRLTPIECERLQGFPDGWTAVDGAADSTRYRQLGNAVAVPVAEWLARRILAAHPPRPAQADADSDERTQDRG